MTASLLDGLTPNLSIRRGPRKIEVGAGYMIQLNPTGPAFKSNKHGGAMMQNYGINLWLKDNRASCLWHLVVLPFTCPPTWDDRQILKLAIKWLLLPPEAWIKKNFRLSPQHAEWLADTEMVNEFKITVAYTLMGKQTDTHAKFAFRRKMVSANAAKRVEDRRAEFDSKQAAYAEQDARRTQIKAEEEKKLTDEEATVQRLQDEASNHGNLLSALSGLRSVESQ